jgi:hypothetical protein
MIGLSSSPPLLPLFLSLSLSLSLTLIGSCHTAQDGLDLTTLQLLPSKYWDYSWMPLYPLFTTFHDDYISNIWFPGL